MTYDDCEAYEAQMAEERAGRLYARWTVVCEDVARMPEGEQRSALTRRLNGVASKLRLAEEDLMEGRRVKTAVIMAELGEIRRALEGTGDRNRTEAS